MELSGTDTSNRAVRTIRLDDESIGRILDSLDQATDDGSQPEEDRKAQRFRYRMPGVIVHMQQPGAGETVPFLVPTRNLSKFELSFLHGGFVHTGTRCLVQLTTTHGTGHNVVCVVVRCRHIESGVHEVAVSCDHELDPAEYCAEASRSRVLVAEDDSTIARLTILHLEQLNADVDHAENGRIAVDRALQEPYDIIIMDIEMPVLDGVAAVQELRAKGYSRMIVAATALTDEEDRLRCLRAGFDQFLPKPFVRDDLKSLLQHLHEEPLVSSLSNDPALAELIAEFVVELPARIRELEIALSENDASALAIRARTLKGQAGSFGFSVITDVATTIENTLRAESSVDNVREDVKRLIKLCLRASAPEHRGGGPTTAV